MTRARPAIVDKGHGDEEQVKIADDRNGDRDQVNMTADVDGDEDQVKSDDDRNGDHGQVMIEDDQNEQKDQVMIENRRNGDEGQMMIAGDRNGQRDQTMIAGDRNEDKDQVMIADDLSDGDNQDEQLSLNVEYSDISKKLVQPPAVMNNSFGSESYAKPTKNISAPYSKYTGRYGNIAYGNISVDIVENNATDDDKVWLIMRYGPIAKWRLEPVGLSHVFKAHGQEPFWYWRMFVWFRVNATAASHVTVLFDAETPPLFTRDLTFADAVASTSTN